MSLTFGNTASTPSSPPSRSPLKSVDPTYVINVPTPASTQINVGDFLFSNSGVAALASNVTWDTNTITTQTNAQAVFLGISLGQKDAADPSTTPIPVSTKGIACYPCAAVNTPYTFGAYVAPAPQSTHNLSDFVAVIATNHTGAIGYLCEDAAANATQLQFYYQSSLIFGALPVAAAS